MKKQDYVHSGFCHARSKREQACNNSIKRGCKSTEWILIVGSSGFQSSEK